MESAEEFARKLSAIDMRDGAFQHENPESIALIEADRAAVAAPLILEIANLNRQLGELQGELEGLRAGWSVSNWEAWEQGWIAHVRFVSGRGDTTTNPFPKPEKNEPSDAE